MNYLGGKCKKCGYKKSPYALDFNHINPTQKIFSITRLLQEEAKWSVIEKEIKKSELLCANCHREHTSLSYYQDIS